MAQLASPGYNIYMSQYRQRRLNQACRTYKNRDAVILGLTDGMSSRLLVSCYVTGETKQHKKATLFSYSKFEEE
jgi:hypothetical protein